MLKKISHITLSILLLAATTGLTISKHYCGDAMNQKEGLADASSCCNTSTDCCEHDVETLRIDNEFEVTKFSADISQSNLLVICPAFEIEAESSNNEAATSYFEDQHLPITLDIHSNIQVYLL